MPYYGLYPLPDWVGVLFAIVLIVLIVWKFAGGLPKVLLLLLSPILIPAMLVGVIFKALFYWLCESMSKLLPAGCFMQNWFYEKYLDMKYPSRVRRRRNGKLSIDNE